MNQDNTQKTQYNQQNQYNQQQGNPNYTNVRDFQPRPQYPRKKSFATIVVGLILILMGTSHILDTFVPWLFAWVDSGLVISCLAIFIGFYMLVKRP